MTEDVVQSFRDLYNKHDFGIDKAQFLDLWHYTSADGLMGIIRDEPCEHSKLHFWFTRSDCLNDDSEGTHILDLFHHVCDGLYEQNYISSQFYELIRIKTIPSYQFINFPIPSKEEFTHESVLDFVECHSYICSFSLKEDSLDMWRYYSKGNGGYGLKCFSFLFENYKKYENSKYDADALFCPIRSFKVIYDEVLKEQMLREITLDVFSAYINSENVEIDKDKEANGFIQHILKQLQFQFKHECYSSEKEYRFIIYLPVKKPNLLKNELPHVRHRIQNGVVVPYIDISVDSGTSYLEEVLVSPYIRNDNVIVTTQDYLKQCGFDCAVKRSTLPVRQ